MDLLSKILFAFTLTVFYTQFIQAYDYSAQFGQLEILESLNFKLSDCSLKKCCENPFCSVYLPSSRSCILGRINGSISGPREKFVIKMIPANDTCLSDVNRDYLWYWSYWADPCACELQFRKDAVNIIVSDTYPTKKVVYTLVSGVQQSTVTLIRNFTVDPSDFLNACVGTIEHPTPINVTATLIIGIEVHKTSPLKISCKKDKLYLKDFSEVIQCWGPPPCPPNPQPIG